MTSGPPKDGVPKGEVKGPFELQSQVAITPAGKTVQVELLRKQSKHALQLTVGTMPKRQ